MVELNRVIKLMLLIAAFCFNKLSFCQEKQQDYTSKVPKYTFATTLAEQEEQLKTNPLMLRFAASRKKMATDKYRPIYHYINPESTLNDPNGLCFWQGRWHLFYQAVSAELRPCQNKVR